MKLLFSILLLLSVVLLPVHSQQASYPITNYTTIDYGKDFHPNNSAIIQDNRGIIYAANALNLLEFDGNKWNSYPINKPVWIYSLAIDSAGVIYAGCQSEFGYFAPDRASGLKYVSLSDSLPIEDMQFSNIWKVHILPGCVVFQSEEKLFFYMNGKITAISPNTTFHTSFYVNGKLYVRQRDLGLFEWNGEKLIKVKGGELFGNVGIFMMIPFGNNNKEILIGTQENGFWIFNNSDPVSKFKRFLLKDQKLLDESKVSSGVVTSHGTFAVATILNGIIIIDHSGNTIAVINEKSGLTHNGVKQIISDRDGNLWLALENGISRIDVSSPISRFGDKAGLSGTINAIERFGNLLYVGTTSGLFVSQPGSLSDKTFNRVFNISSSVRSLVNAGGYLLAGTVDGLYIINENRVRILDKNESYSLWYSPDLKLLFSGGPKGLLAFETNRSFHQLNLSETIKDDIAGISGINLKKTNQSLIWVGTKNSSVIRITINKDLSNSIARFGKNDGIAEGAIFPFSYKDSVLFSTIYGMFCFTDEDAAKKDLPDSLKDNKDYAKGYFSICSSKFRSAGKNFTSLVETDNKLWICADNKVGYYALGNLASFINQPFGGIEAGKINLIYPEKNNITWIGTSDGLYKFDGNISKDYNTPYYSLIRKMTAIRNDSSIFSGVNYESFPAGFRILPEQPEASVPVLPFNLNSLRIEFAAPFFEHIDKTMYSSYLVGYDSRWGGWESKQYQDYKNLPEGDYTFRVKARNVYGTESVTSEYRFTILPPWYKTTWAFIFYGIGIIFLMWLVVRIYSLRLTRENLRLEGIVAERTIEVVKQKNEIENKNVVLEFQKKEIQDSIRYARRIQKAVIPEEFVFTRMLPEGFVFFKPLEIVSGDFYWISRLDSKTIITAADCTGHGVPGAFMSMLGVAFLNEIVNKDLVTETDVILNRLRDKVIDALQQRGITGEARDGMDISVLCLDEETNTLQYSGAFNPLLMVRNDILTEIEADRMPIAIYDNMPPFTKHDISLQSGDKFYIFSDGYIDQFGGPNGKKFKMKEFKQLLVSIHKLPMELQKEKLSKTFEEWRGDLKQIDDIVVVGLGIK